MGHRVDIVVRAKDGRDLTTACVGSILAETTPGLSRIILVQSGMAVVPPVDLGKGEMVFVTVPEPVGAVRATNLGIGIALTDDAPYVLILDNDTEIPLGDKTWLERMIAELEQHDDTAAVGAVSDFCNPPQQCLANPQTYTADWKDEDRSGSKDNPPIPWFVSFAVLLRKDVLRQLGPWDERYDPGNFEDTDYALRCREAGYQIRVARSVWIHHKGHKTFGPDLQELMRTNHVKFAQKWGLGRLWDMGIAPAREVAIAAGRQAGILKETNETAV